MLRPPGPRRATGETDPSCDAIDGGAAMRRFVILAGAASAGALAWTRVKGRRPAIPKPVTGVSHNGMAYARWGTGPRRLLVIPGGPGNTTPKGMFLSRHLRVVRPLVEDGWTAWVVTRKQHMPQGYSIADMADDYARLIADELGGKVEAAIGVSTGGMIGLHLAARHPHRLGRIVIAVAGYMAHGEGDLRFAQLLHDGRTAEAIASMFGDAFPDVRVPGAPRVAGALLGPLVLRGAHVSFLDDVLIEAEAERAFDARAILPGITIPVLLACGGEDQIFRREVVEETARLIPDCSLVIYEGRDHVGGVSDERLPTDVFEFIVSRSPTGPEARGTEPLPATA